MRVQNSCEKNIVAVPANPITVPTSVSTDVLDDVTKERNQEFAARYIFNSGANTAYYAFGQDCDNNKNYHGYLVSGQQLDCSNTCQRVSVYSVGGTTIAPTIFRRLDNAKHVSILQGALP